jgi:hypothetical protein
VAAVAVIAGLFGAATIASGGRVLFGGEAVRAAAGHYVPFVLWFNFLAGFAYLLAAAGIALGRRWAAALSATIAAATLVVGLAFGAHLVSGGAHEPRTVAAMALRLLVWTAIAVLLGRRRPG